MKLSNLSSLWCLSVSSGFSAGNTAFADYVRELLEDYDVAFAFGLFEGQDVEFFAWKAMLEAAVSMAAFPDDRELTDEEDGAVVLFVEERLCELTCGGLFGMKRHLLRARALAAIEPLQ